MQKVGGEYMCTDSVPEPLSHPPPPVVDEEEDEEESCWSCCSIAITALTYQ